MISLEDFRQAFEGNDYGSFSEEGLEVLYHYLMDELPEDNSDIDVVDICLNYKERELSSKELRTLCWKTELIEVPRREGVYIVKAY